MPQYPGHERPPPRGRRAPQRGRRRRELGQNFLHDPAEAARLVALAQLKPGDLAVDLGAGRGALTAPLAAAAGHVVAVEHDPAWARALRVRFADHEHVQVVAGDLLGVPLPGEPFTVVANLPYAVGTKAVRRLLVDGHGLRAAVLVLQLEAARRIAGIPGSGRFVATWAPWYTVDLVATLPATAFRPVPSVDAGVLKITPRRLPLLTPAAFAYHVSVIDATFQTGRGRTVAQRLGRLAGSPTVARAVLKAAGIDPRATPSELRPESWAAITRALSPGGSRRAPP
jgi:23S rRNA (adenine-N6)-dimethyltransferase